MKIFQRKCNSTRPAILALFLVIGCTNDSAPRATQSTGEALLMTKGCVACHSSTGQPGVGPTFKGLFGRTETFTDGTSLVVDEAYVKESIRKPTAKVVRPFQPTMPAMPMTDEELQAIVDHLRTLK